LKQDYDQNWFIARDSDHYQYLAEKKALFPDWGENSFVIIGRVNYSQELSKIVALSDHVESQTEILYDFQSWTKPFQEFVLRNYGKNFLAEPLNDTDWRQYLTQFLYSSTGGKYQQNFKFDSKLQCGEPAPNIKVKEVILKILSTSNSTFISDVYNRF
jgi:Niemann-Pick C1 protein